MPRITSITVTFAAVTVAYWLYAVTVVPLVEPSASGHATSAMPEGGEGLLDDRVAALRTLFPAGSWALKEPKILENDRVKLLMQR